MNFSPVRPGYTLPVFACASSLAALQHLHDNPVGATVSVDLLEPPRKVEIPIEQVARLSPNSALAITLSDPGDNLDLTRNTPIWALVEIDRNGKNIEIKGGEGIGKQVNRDDEAAIYSYARRLLIHNLESLLREDESVTVTIILPFGKQLAARTSNAAFGVVEGLSLLGTTGISSPLSVPEQLNIFREELTKVLTRFDGVVFCVGENGLDLTRNLGINPEIILKTANWIGPMLVEAALQGAREILLFGYHGKLIKLAGGIFHTHHHLADARLEILTATAAKMGLDTVNLQQLLTCPTVEAGRDYLKGIEGNPADRIYGEIAAGIDRRSGEYIYQHTDRRVKVGSVLFDRSRSIIARSSTGQRLLEKFIL